MKHPGGASPRESMISASDIYPADGAGHAQELSPTGTSLLGMDVVVPTIVMEVMWLRALRHLELPRVAADRAHANGAGLPLVRGIAKSIHT